MLSFRSRQSSIVPETSVPDPSVAELTIRVNVLANEVARLSRELASVRATAGAAQSATNGPLPESPAQIMSGRSGMRYIAHLTGRNEDTVRATLRDSAKFASLRERAPDITTNVPLMRWLASPAQDDLLMRYELILTGMSTPEALASEAGR